MTADLERLPKWLTDKADKWRSEGRFTDDEWGAINALFYVAEIRPATPKEVREWNDRAAALSGHDRDQQPGVKGVATE